MLILRELGKIATTGNNLISTPPSAPTISNLRDKGVTYSGFIIGTSTQGTLALSSVEVSLDNGSYSQATGTTSWKFQLPTGSSTWRDNTKHTISVRAKDVNGNVSAITTISARKGQNKDINGDGYSDVVVGAYGVNANQGKVYIFHSEGAAGVASIGAGSANATLTGVTGGDQFGNSITIGDVNGDGYSDVAVGARAVNAGGGTNQGTAYIFHSAGTTGIASIGAGSANTTLTGVTGGDLFGDSMTIGDVNGDGYSDVVVGAYGFNAGANQGRVYIFHSAGAAGVASIGAGSAITTLTGVTGGDIFGNSITIGDVNGDGYSDVAVGARAVNAGGGANQGRVYIFHSAGAAGVASIGAGSANTTLTGVTGGDLFGFSITIGDVNGDGYSDVAVGANGFNAGANQGRVYIFHSAGTAGVASIGAGSANTTLTGVTGGDLFGISITIGDVNGDGYSDVAAGAYGFNAGANQGRVYIFHSAGAAGVASIGAGSANTTLTGVTGGDIFGNSITIGDVNGDGYSDVAVGTYVFNAGGGANQGRVYIFHSAGTAGVASIGAGSANATLTGVTGGDLFGRAL